MTLTIWDIAAIKLLVRQGRDNNQIAVFLNLSVKDVYCYRYEKKYYKYK